MTFPNNAVRAVTGRVRVQCPSCGAVKDLLVSPRSDGEWEVSHLGSRGMTALPGCPGCGGPTEVAYPVLSPSGGVTV